ncbi:MAG TPA: FkbM family methyltransferase [Jatrophihabitantaceae bacterium]|nr:FkbM family methyltransferase [Jatrophihabitantaceae bacterium]
MAPAWRSQVYAARRLAQTPRTFSNWMPVLVDMAQQRVGHGPQSLSFRSRSGITISCPNRPGARVPVYEIFAEDCYRLGWWLGPLLHAPIVAVDIGGHVGTFSCRLAELNPQAQILAYEPSATTAGYLRRNVEQNGFAGRVTVNQLAVAATGGETMLFEDNEGGSGLNGLVAAGHASAGAAEVHTTTFDEIVEAAPGPVDVVKIDCEGGEYDVVLASSAESWKSVQRVVMEYHPVAGHSWDELRDRFADWGLHVQRSETVNGYGCVWLSRETLPASTH